MEFRIYKYNLEGNYFIPQYINRKRPRENSQRASVISIESHAAVYSQAREISKIDLTNRHMGS